MDKIVIEPTRPLLISDQTDQALDYWIGRSLGFKMSILSGFVYHEKSGFKLLYDPTYNWQLIGPILDDMPNEKRGGIMRFAAGYQNISARRAIAIAIVRWFYSTDEGKREYDKHEEQVRTALKTKGTWRGC